MSRYPIQELAALRKSGQTDTAYRRGRQLIELHPNDAYLKNMFGWVLYDKVRQLTTAPRTDPATQSDRHRQISDLLREYAGLGLDRPDLLFSQLVNSILRLPSLPPFVLQFLHWAEINSFRIEDLKTSEGRSPDVVYPPLIERAANKVGKLAVDRKEDFTRSDLEFALEIIDFADSEGQVQHPLMLTYRKGLLLRELGRQNEAREQLVYFVKKKPREFWAWHALALCSRTESPSDALALCAKAYLVADYKKFAVKVLMDITQLGLDLERTDIAKWALDTHISIRRNADWAIPESTLILTSSKWYKTATALTNPEKILEGYAESTEELLFKGCWRKANYLTSFTGQNGLEIAKIAIQTDSGTVVNIARANRFPALSESMPGTPLYSAVDSEQERVRIVGLKMRTDGLPFDCLTDAYGILDHHNPAKQLASVYLKPNDFSLLRYTDFAEVQEWPPGSAIVVKRAIDQGGPKAYRIERTEFRETAFIRRSIGELRIHARRFGFVGDVFVPPRVIQSVSQGDRVTVVALKKPKRKGASSELGWQAVSIRLHASQE